MAKLVATMAVAAVVLVIMLPLTPSEAQSDGTRRVLDVFEIGNVPTTYLQVNESATPFNKSVLIYKPTLPCLYPVIMLLHGTCLINSFYTDLFQHIASHGYIVVAPQIYYCFEGLFEMMPISEPEELEYAAEVANWLPSGLQSLLPENIKPDLHKLSVGGHSRGGKTAVALALGYAKTPLQVQISGLVLIDPVAGASKNNPTLPKVLTYIPHSFNLSIPVAVIGTGLGSQPVCWLVCPACAPNGVNHVEFFNECKAPAGHFVATDYGHMDMLNDNITGIDWIITSHMCKSSPDPKKPMRQTVGGIIVAFFKAYFEGESDDYMTIVQQPSVAPAKLDPVQFNNIINIGTF
ncbi:chlorophyllase-1-like [Mercurialis annua]|uniref:chlorophyllase-1-like n=1 Tax=Mercurialis annua TaxID=3986 RepID=UPI00215F55F2|nr:chlorophyllase-1-like [Mercurialis annua]